MSKTISLVQRVRIASPCTADWDQMAGNEQVRFCSQCQLNVYNLSEMSQDEGERLILEKEGKLCARIYRRHDGTVITRDCPRGLTAIRRRVMGIGARVAAAILLVFATTVLAAFGSRSRDSRDQFTRTVHMIELWLNSYAPPQALGGVVMIQPPGTAYICEDDAQD